MAYQLRSMRSQINLKQIHINCCLLALLTDSQPRDVKHNPSLALKGFIFMVLLVMLQAKLQKSPLVLAISETSTNGAKDAMRCVLLSGCVQSFTLFLYF